MTSEKFETKLFELVADAQSEGVSNSDILDGLSIVTQAVTDELADEEKAG